MDKVYVGGGLFSQAQINQRLVEGKLLKNIGIDYYNPIENDEINDKSNLPTAYDIFMGDLQHILESSFILADIQDMDEGLLLELGIVIGLQMAKNIDLDLIPKQQIVAHNSDIRLGTNGEYNGMYVPYGLNQFVIGAIEEYGIITRSSEEAINYIDKNKAQK
jgi:hypothetical protein